MEVKVDYKTKPPNVEADTRRRNIFFVFSLGVCTLIIIFLGYLFTAPFSTTFPTVFKVQSGEGASSITKSAKSAGLVRSSTILYLIIAFKYDPTNIYAGEYLFENPMSVFRVADFLANGNVKEEMVKITIPEGTPARDIANIIHEKLPTIEAEEYFNVARLNEGYLYPETYFIPEHYNAEEIIALQLRTYNEEVATLRNDIDQSTYTEKEILTLASIIEREANDEESMRTIAGIFKNRLQLGMPLQADASIEYALERPVGTLKNEELAENLRELDSPYNTYLYAGLPPTPIGNPGIISIKALLYPIETDYLYYLTDEYGEFHYARTLDEHNENINRYLR